MTGSLGITAAGFDNSSIIRASSIFNVTVATLLIELGQRLPLLNVILFMILSLMRALLLV